jgi:hypothetical protein
MLGPGEAEGGEVRELDIERTCTDFLALDGWRCVKTDPCSDRSRGKGFGEKGMADCLYLRYEVPPGTRRRGSAEAMWIEWKGPRGRVKSHQGAWHVAERARGALTLLAIEDFPATIDGFMEFYRGSGLCKRKGL